MVEPNRHSVRTYICSWYVILTIAMMSHVRNENHAPVCVTISRNVVHTAAYRTDPIWCFVVSLLWTRNISLVGGNFLRCVLAKTMWCISKQMPNNKLWGCLGQGKCVMTQCVFINTPPAASERSPNVRNVSQSTTSGRGTAVTFFSVTFRIVY